jgi:hypothetical protein
MSVSSKIIVSNPHQVGLAGSHRGKRGNPGTVAEINYFKKIFQTRLKFLSCLQNFSGLYVHNINFS